MASIHESFEYPVNEITELFNTSMITGVIITVDHENNTADVEIDGLGAVPAIPIHYHCEGATTVDDGHLAFADDDEVLIWAKSLHEMKIVGFPDGIKACGEFVYVEYGSYCFIWNPVDNDYAKIKKPDNEYVDFPALKSDPTVAKWLNSTEELETNECYPDRYSEGMPSIAFEASSPFIEETEETNISPGDICVFSDIVPGQYDGDLFNAYGKEQNGNIAYYDGLSLQYKSKHQTYYIKKTCGSTQCLNPPWCTLNKFSLEIDFHHEVNDEMTKDPFDHERATWEFPAIRSTYPIFDSNTLISNLEKRSGFYTKEIGYATYREKYEVHYISEPETDDFDSDIEINNYLTYEYYSPFGKMNIKTGLVASYDAGNLYQDPGGHSRLYIKELTIAGVPHKESSKKEIIAIYSEKTMVQVFLIQALLLGWYEPDVYFNKEKYNFLKVIHSYTKPAGVGYPFEYDGRYTGTTSKEEDVHAACGSYLSDDISTVEPSDQGRNFGFESALATLMDTTTDIYDMKVEIRRPKIV